MPKSIYNYPLVPSDYTWHMSHVHKRVSKLVNYEGLYPKKTDLFDLADISPWLRDGHWLLGHVSHLGAIFSCEKAALEVQM